MKVCVVAHDAGGANILASYVRRSPYEHVLSLSGPAVSIFERVLGTIQNNDLEEAIAKSEKVLTGSGWQSDLEFNAILLARQLNKYVSTFLDHWVNYTERFIRNGRIALPDEFWVGDELAYKIASEDFPSTKILQTSNPYFEESKVEYLSRLNSKKASSTGTKTYLYIGENIGDHAELKYGDRMHNGFDEIGAFQLFLNWISRNDPSSSVIFRPHPSETHSKYLYIADQHNINCHASRNFDLIDDFLESDIVVGVSSAALILASFLQLPVYTCIPKSSLLPNVFTGKISDLCIGTP